jgi:hypothetical protein
MNSVECETRPFFPLAGLAALRHLNGHLEVARGMHHQAMLWWITPDLFMELCSLKI